MNADRVAGTVKSYNPIKGYGFIVPDGGGRDIFVHSRTLAAGGLRELHSGQRVTFIVEIRDGRLRAAYVEMAREPAMPAASAASAPQPSAA